MDKSDRDSLRRNRLDLCQDLDAKQATQFLFSKDILSDKDKQDIDANNTQRERSEALLDILPRRGPNAFNAFLEFLGKNQVHLSKLLQPVAEGIFMSAINSVRDGLSFAFVLQQIASKGIVFKYRCPT